MKQKLLLSILMLPSLLLVSCNTRTSTSFESTSFDSSKSSLSETSSTTSSSVVEQRSFVDMYEDLKKPMTITGKAYEIIGQGEGTRLTNDINVILGEKSFHIEQKGESASIISTVYTDDDKQNALHYYINSMNEVEYEIIKDSDGNNVSWKEYANPFLYVDSSIFIEESEGVYVVDLENEDIREQYNYLVNNLTYINFPKLSEQYIDTFEYIRFTIE